MRADPMRAVYLHDTRTGRVRPIEPREPGRVGIYACGPTVYGRIHVGNARPFVVFSLLKRFLVHEGYDVTLVFNITDVNDKIYAAAQRAGVPSERLARQMTDAYIADTNALGLGRPDHEPRASETIPEIVSLIGQLLDREHAYEAQGDVYFQVRSYPDYGELSHRRVDDMDQGEGLEGAERKRDPLDFALWKVEKPGEDTSWGAPWGRGRPGWHIECSAMAEGLLGLDFEVHGGGSDLIFPHHENEAAQTSAARGTPLARLWMHNGMVRLGAEKMAKSVGNIFVLHEALATYGRDALIMYFCGGHYRQPVEFDDERMEEATARVRRIREAARRLNADASSSAAPATAGASTPPVPANGRPGWSGALRERFFDSLADDFNTPRALAAVFDWVREANRCASAVGAADLREMLGVLGLDNLLEPERIQVPPGATALVDARERARAARDYAQADRLREQLRETGWEVRDGPNGPELLPTQSFPS